MVINLSVLLLFVVPAATSDTRAIRAERQVASIMVSSGVATDRACLPTPSCFCFFLLRIAGSIRQGVSGARTSTVVWERVLITLRSGCRGQIIAIRLVVIGHHDPVRSAA